MSLKALISCALTVQLIWHMLKVGFIFLSESHPCLIPGDINNSRGDCSDFCFPVPVENTTTLTRKCGCPFGKSLFDVAGQ